VGSDVRLINGSELSIDVGVILSLRNMLELENEEETSTWSG
jgi:hypothetical protein